MHQYMFTSKLEIIRLTS